jgi:hypothetical protein
MKNLFEGLANQSNTKINLCINRGDLRAQLRQEARINRSLNPKN